MVVPVMKIGCSTPGPVGIQIEQVLVPSGACTLISTVWLTQREPPER